MANLVLKQGEAKTVTFTVTDAETLASINLTGCTFAFAIRPRASVTAVVTVADTDFTKTLEASGIVSIFLTGTHTNQTPGNYIGELKVTFTGSPAPVDKSADLEIIIQRATNS